MEFQEAVILSLAITATILSILSIIFGIIFFIKQTQSSQNIAKDNYDFTQQMNILLNEIRTSQNITGQQVKDQYDKLLDAALRGGGSIDAAATSAIQLGEFNEQLDSLAKAVSGLKEPGQIDDQIKELRKVEETLNKAVRQLATYVAEDVRLQPSSHKATFHTGITFPLFSEHLRFEGSGEQPKTSTSRFEKFTERARRVLIMAQEEAREFNHSYIGTEHFLLGLLREEDGKAAKVLKNLNINLLKVRAAVEFIIGHGEKPISDRAGLTPRAKAVIKLAIDEASKLKNNYVGTEHLLLGILREGEGVAFSVLDTFGLTLKNVKSEVRKINKSGS